MPDPSTVDLREFAERLKALGADGEDFARRVEQGIATRAAREDLVLSKACLREIIPAFLTMSPVVEEVQSASRATIGGALFFQAVFMYGRATETTSKLRVKSGIAERLKGEWRDLHARFMNLRNDAMAHVTGGGNGWSKEALVLHQQPDRYTQFFLPWQRYNHRVHDVWDLDRLVDAAIVQADALFVERRERIIDKINAMLGQHESAIHMAWAASIFDENAFFTPCETAEAFRRIVQAGGDFTTSVMRRPGPP